MWYNSRHFKNAGRCPASFPKVKFTYTYRTSDGIRHTAEIDAPTRDSVFSTLREQGIKPIKVVAADGSRANGEPHVRIGVPKKVVAGICAALFVAVGVAYWMGSHKGAADVSLVVTPQGPVSYTVASPLPRQAIAGDRRRIEKSLSEIFSFPAEMELARFAEPGRNFDLKAGGNPGNGIVSDVCTSGKGWKDCLDTPIRIASSDLTEVVDLKRIVAGMKREMRAYLMAGGTVEDYLAELKKRQRLEMSYRERAESRLGELLAELKQGNGKDDKRLDVAYSYWIKSNASLKSMGIYELALPDVLREYQSNIDLEY